MSEAIPDPRAALDALGHVLAGGAVDAQGNGGRILSYLVTEAIEGRADRIKAVSIAQDVLGRGSEFDPSKDSAVRVEVKRLREALEHHYRTEGRDDPLRIVIPKGRYVPDFVPARPPDSPAPPARPARPGRRRRAWVAGGTVAVVAALVAATLWVRGPAGGIGGQIGDGRPTLALEGRETLALEADTALHQLSAFDNLRLLEGGPSDYVLVLEHFRAGEPEEVISIRLLRASDGTLISARVFPTGTLGSAARPDEKTPFRVWLSHMVERNGRIEMDFAEREPLPGDFACVRLTEAYFVRQTDARHAAALDCVDELSGQGVETAQLAVLEALLLREAYTNRHGPGASDPDGTLEAALAAAREALGRAPLSPQAHYAMMTVLFVAGATDEAMAYGARAAMLNPWDGEALGGIAARMAYLGRHAEALPLLERSAVLAPGAAKWRDYARFLIYVAEGDVAAAGRTGLSLRGTENALYVAAEAIGFAVADMPVQARATVDRLREREPDLREMYERRRYAPELVDRLVSALEAI